MYILGIETSCDETSAAVVTADRQILSNVIQSQINQHIPYGGVVPELAARAHLAVISSVIQQALEIADVSLQDIDAVAVTAGPGLIGGVMVGVMTAKGIAAALNKPFLAINHLEAHALTARLSHNVSFPYLLLLVSGGHCQFLEVFGVGNYRLLGGTIDDAVGEAFDKIAKSLGFDYPGGPVIETLAKTGNPKRFSFPRPLLGKAGCDFSFSGLKTAVRVQIEKLQELTDEDKCDIAASFQEAICDCLIDRLEQALRLSEHPHSHVVLSGGVAANQKIRSQLLTICQNNDIQLVAPPLELCTDNAAMVAWVGVERYQLGFIDDLSFTPRPRWPLVDK